MSSAVVIILYHSRLRSEHNKMRSFHLRKIFHSGDERNFWSRVPAWIKDVLTIIGLVFLATLVSGIVATMRASKGGKPSCEIKACKKTSAMIRANMNTKVHPCDNFYEYACGNFKMNHQIPDDKPRYSYFEIISDEVETILHEELSKSSPVNETKALSFIRQRYQNCTRADMKKDGEGMKLVELFSDDKTITELIILALKHNVSSYFSIITIDDSSDPGKTILVLDQPKFTVAKRDLTDRQAERIRSAYLKVIRAGLRLYAPNLTDTASEILKMEMNLAKIAVKDEDRRDLIGLFKNVSVSELADHIKSIDMKEIFKTFSRGAKIDEVFVGDMEYFKRLDKALDTHNSRAYHVWKVIEMNGRSSNFTDAQFEFEKVRTGVKKKPSRKSICISSIIGRVPFIAGRVLVDAKKSTKQKMRGPEEMIHRIQQSMEKMINEAEWMDDKTWNQAIRKLRKMTVNVGYPEWIKNDTLLSGTIPDRYRHSALKSMLKMQKFTAWKRKLMQRMIDPHDKWVMSPAGAGAVYASWQNSITLPAAMLVYPFYEPSRLDYLNYGGIGFVIGHEISHGFDDRNAQYDADGTRTNWWTNSTLKRFHDHTEQIVKEYSGITDKTTGLHLNGKNTQGENIADFGGIRAAYAAVFDSKKDHPPLTGMDSFSPQQMFFLSHANALCSLIRPEALRQSIITDTHSPAEYRVNVPLRNFEKFAQAFSCPKNSPMNPHKKIRVW